MAVTTNKNQWVSTFANSIGANNPPQAEPEGGEGGNNEVDKYDALETTSYKDMLSSKIQAANAKDQAMKYAGSALSSSGLGGQGIAESTRAGIVNTYNKSIMEADETHNQNLLDIETQRQDEMSAQGEEDWQSAMTMMQQATSQEDLDYLKSEFYDGFTEKQKKMFDYYYSSFSRDLESGDVQANAQWADRVFTTAELKEKDGMSYKEAVQTDALINQIAKDGSTEGGADLQNFYMTANNGDIVQMDYTAKNGSGTKYAMYYNGKLYYVDSSLVSGRTPKIIYKVNVPNVKIN